MPSSEEEPTKHTNPLRALVVLEPSLASSAFVKAWLEKGNSISAFWTTDARSLSATTNQRLTSLAASTPTLDYWVRSSGIPVIRLEKIPREAKAGAFLQETDADTLITLMTHQIIPDWLLARFGARAVNVHPALLPYYKGPRPILSLLADGRADQYGGITIHRLESGIDTGPIIAQRRVPFSPCGNLHVWNYRLALAASDLARNELQSYLNGELAAVPQIEGSGNYRKSDRLEFVVNADKSLEEVRRLFSLPKGVALRVFLGASASARDSYLIHRSCQALSSPTGAPPRVSAMSVEMDILDCRLRFRRKRKVESFLTGPATTIASYRIRNIFA